MQKIIDTLRSSYWKAILMGTALWIGYRAVVDMNGFPPNSRLWMFGRWAILTVLLIAVILLILGLFTNKLNKILFLTKVPLWLRVAFMVVINLFLVLVLLYLPWGINLRGIYLRLAIYLIVSALSAFLMSQERDQFPKKVEWFVAFGITAFLFAFIIQLTGVRTTPFSLTWSEGNRFYDYSLTFANNLYLHSGDLHVPYNTPGRYALWGLPFLIPGLPIWFHRLWDALLWGLTPLILTMILARKIDNPLLRWGMIFWGAIFIMQGPVYPHLIVPMIFLALIIRTDKLWIKVIAGAIISYYAGISRFTWAILPGVWLVIYDLIENYPGREGNWFKRLIPTIILGLAGIIPGVLGTWGGVINPGQSFATTQPLLINRLFPNSTYGMGILLGAALGFLPVIIVLSWLIATGKWKLSHWALAAIIVGLIGFLAIGLTASTKIGGGSNLHNLDMFILTLVFLGVMAVTQLQTQFEAIEIKTPHWILIILLFAVIFPGWVAYRTGSPYKAVPADLEKSDLATINAEVEKAKSQGEVLFIDQRQLLTFGYIKDVALIPEYEKKYMMDQAMGSNQRYFEQFYQDLSSKRFKLIVSDIQKTQFQNQNDAFSEENNSFVEWVSKPILRYYQPIVTIKELGIQLLVPK